MSTITYAMVDENDFYVGRTSHPQGPYRYFPVTDTPALTGTTPTERLKWNGGSPVLVETATLDDLKARKNSEITAQRLTADADHFIYAGKAIRTADKDMMDLLVADARIRKGFPANWPGGWKAIDNTYVPISTVDQWDAFFIAMYDAGIANFTHSQNLKAAVAGAGSAEQIAAIHW